MSLPAPLTLKLKRKPHHEPVDAICSFPTVTTSFEDLTLTDIESETEPENRDGLELHYVYKRVKSSQNLLEPSINQPTDTHGVPIVFPTTSDDPATLSAQLRQFNLNGANQLLNAASPLKTSLSQPSFSLPVTPTSRLSPGPSPRRFYLSRPITPVPSKQYSKDTLTKRKRRDVPVFEERNSPKKARLDGTFAIRPAAANPSEVGPVSGGLQIHARRSNKRPIVTAAEKEFRQHEWASSKAKHAQDSGDDRQQLDPVLQDLLKEVNASGESTIIQPSHVREYPHHLSGEENPSTTQSSFAVSDTDAMDIDMNPEDSFVYDVYIRELIPKDEKFNLPNYGLAIIENDSWEDWQEEEEVADDDVDSNGKTSAPLEKDFRH